MERMGDKFSSESSGSRTFQPACSLHRHISSECLIRLRLNKFTPTQATELMQNSLRRHIAYSRAAIVTFEAEWQCGCISISIADCAVVCCFIRIEDSPDKPLPSIDQFCSPWRSRSGGPQWRASGLVVFPAFHAKSFRSRPPAFKMVPLQRKPAPGFAPLISECTPSVLFASYLIFNGEMRSILSIFQQ